MFWWLAIVAAASIEAASVPSRWAHSQCVLPKAVLIAGGVGNLPNPAYVLPATTNDTLLALNLTQRFSTADVPFASLAVNTSSAAVAVPGFETAAMFPLTGRPACLINGGTPPAPTQPAGFMLTVDNPQQWIAATNPEDGPVPRRRLHTAVAATDAAYVFGGVALGGDPSAADVAANAMFNEVWRLDYEQLTWAVVPPANATDALVPAPRYGHSASWVGDRMVVLGGFTRPGLESMRTAWIWHPATNAWERLSCTGDVPPDRREHSAVVVGSRIVVFGGSDAGHNHTLADVAVLDVDKGVWSRPKVSSDVGAGPVAGRRAHTAAAIDGTQMLAFFGYNDETTAPADPQVLVLDMVNWQWTQEYDPAGRTRGAAARVIDTADAAYNAMSSSKVIIAAAFGSVVVLLIVAVALVVMARKRIQNQESTVFDPNEQPPRRAAKEEQPQAERSAPAQNPGHLAVAEPPARTSTQGFLWFEDGGGGKSGAKVRKFFGVDNG